MKTTTEKKEEPGSFRRWLLEGHIREVDGPYERDTHQHEHPWWKVMCLTGVDYFSTLGYQPGIAALAAGYLSPIATLILVLLTLFAALPIYRRVAQASPHGEGSISMLEDLLPRWSGKLFVLVLLGFVATDFIITITLSAADATAHIVENPYFPAFLEHHIVGITLILIALLSAVFLKGFREAIGIAVFLVGAYLLLNAVVIGVSLAHVAQAPGTVSDWVSNLYTQRGVGGSPVMMVLMALWLFPKLALGLSGFETGVAVMPLVKGDPGDEHDKPVGRIRNTHKLLTTAALIMSVYLLASSFVTTVLIPHAEFEEGGKAAGRALAYLAHLYLGDAFGTIYDLSTIAILWFAGASAMAGLLNIVPRYLPRYGMAPDWTRAVRPLVIVFSVVGFAVTILFRADVEAQGGAYATGVLVLMTSAAVAVTLAARRERRLSWIVACSLITVIFFYTTIVNVIERPEGIKIASFFIAAIVVTSMISRVFRSTELRTERVEMDPRAQKFIDEMASHGQIHVIANKRQAGDALEYRLKEKEQREDNNIPRKEPVVFFEVDICDASDFTDVVEVKGLEITDNVGRQNGRAYRILRAESSAVPNAIAAFLLHIRDTTGLIPHAYFSWSEGNPLQYLAKFVLFGEGDTAPVTREVLRREEPDPERRPSIHVGG